MAIITPSAISVYQATILIIGFFGHIASDTVRDPLLNPVVSGYAQVAGVAGVMEGSVILNRHVVNGTISGTDEQVGGICGKASSGTNKILYCTASGLSCFRYQYGRRYLCHYRKFRVCNQRLYQSDDRLFHQNTRRNSRFGQEYDSEQPLQFGLDSERRCSIGRRYYWLCRKYDDEPLCECGPCVGNNNVRNVGAVYGYSQNLIATNRCYDKQFCLMRKSPLADSLPTADMVGSKLQSRLGDEEWLYAEGRYPRIKYTDTTCNSRMATIAVQLWRSSVSDTLFDNISNVENNFRISVNDNVKWSCSSDVVTFKG